jgi:hypothetical protein
VIKIASREMGMRPMWVCSSSNLTFLIEDPVTKDLGKRNYWQTEESIIIILSMWRCNTFKALRHCMVGWLMP